jgi:hypothetical protein
MGNPSNEMQVRGEAVGVGWDGAQGASAYGNRVRKAELEASDVPLEAPKRGPERKSGAGVDSEAAIRALWRQGRRKEALAYGKS